MVLSSLPTGYREPVVLRADAHRHLRLKPLGDFSFVARSNAVPLCPSEFMPAVRHFPIVFAAGPKPMALAVLGLKAEQNLFVGIDGQWRADTYIPAYLRRYPFIPADVADGRSLLAVDLASSRLVEGDGGAGEEARPLFDAQGAPAPALQEAIGFCDSFQEDQRRGDVFASALAAAGLLVTRSADMQFPDQSRYTLQGFSVVDPALYRALPATTLEDWHRRGWTDAIALHLASARNWDLLFAANSAR